MIGRKVLHRGRSRRRPPRAAPASHSYAVPEEFKPETMFSFRIIQSGFRKEKMFDDPQAVDEW
jgi:hypothetical protein